MGAKKKALQPMQGFFDLMPDAAAGENQKSSPAKISIAKSRESSAVKGVAVADGAQHP